MQVREGYDKSASDPAASREVGALAVRFASPGQAHQDLGVSPAPRLPRWRFDRYELAGAFGDIGTDLPLLVALVATCGLDAASVAIVFGLLQIATGVVYGLPMPVQPLKAMAVIMLSQKLSYGTLVAGGLVVGLAMFLLALTGALDGLARLVPRPVVRGIQLGLGLTLATVALKQYAATGGLHGYLLAGGAVGLLIVLGRQRRVPPALVVIGLGLLYGGWVLASASGTFWPVGFSLPRVVVPTPEELVQGALLLALPQIALSLGNSVLATSQATRDLFPDRPVAVRKIGLTYGLMNLAGPWFGGVPACHGCGGLVGFYNFGARTGGAPVLYGSFYLAVGLFLASGFTELSRIFPMPILGAVLLVEALGLMLLARDALTEGSDGWVAFAVAAAVLGLPNGYVVGLVGGTLLAWMLRKGWGRAPGA